MDLQQLFSTLEIQDSDSLILLSDDKWKNKVSFPSRIIRLLESSEKWSPKAIFSMDNKPLILFFENPENTLELHKSVWNFNETPIVFIIENGIVSIYNGFEIVENTKLLNKLGGSEVLNDFKYFELVTGKTFEKYKKDFYYKNRVDYKLLENIEDTRNELINLIHIETDCKTLSKALKTKTANFLLGKIIFISYLIDRKVKLNFDGTSREWTNQEFCDLLLDRERVFDFFVYLQDKDKGFNGDLFPIDRTTFNAISDDALKLIIRLLKSDDIKTGQPSLFKLYDFSVLPIEFISNVYEKFIGIENQSKSGAYYTPTFLVDYIINQTVAKKLKGDSESSSCKVLDPACGSGIFLVEALRRIIEKHIDINGIPEDKLAFKETIKDLARNNIFGIDKDENAVQVAIFSIYLTLLDYQKPAEIESFQFPKLLKTNFFVADFFDTNADYNEVFKSIEFDFILGNPPWYRGKGEKETPLYVKYINNRRKKEKSKGQPPCVIGGKEISQAFLIRISDFSNTNTESALIVTSKTLYNLESKEFRTYFLHNFKIQRVFELAPVRREVFDKSNTKAIAPACILFYRYSNGNATDDNLIEHIALKPSRFFSLFKVFSIYRNDIQTVQQNRLKTYDWLWKNLVYGSYLDFILIKRLKNDFPSIDETLELYKIIRKQGIKRVDGENKIDVSELKGWDFLDLSKEIKQNYISKSHQKWELDEVGYIYKEDNKICKEIFTPPMLLIKETVNTRLESISAISYQRLLFTDKITSLKFRSGDNIEIYRLLLALLNSSMFAYYIMNTSSTAGIMIEQQINDKERFSFPYIYSKEIIESVVKLEEYIITQYSLNMADTIIESNISKMREQLNKQICEALSLTEEETILFQYTIDVTIPIQMRHKGYENLLLSFDFEDKALEEYAQLFIDRFQKNLSNNDRKFIVEIHHTKQIIGMLFKVVPIKEYKQDFKWENKQTESEIVKNIAQLGTKRITDQLFVQKDVRGFEKDFFYIFKPNEKRLWHKAIGYLDVNEFADAILKAGRDTK